DQGPTSNPTDRISTAEADTKFAPVKSYCTALATAVANTQSIDYRDPQGVLQDLIIEPLTFMPNLRQITFQVSQGSKDVMSNLMLLPIQTLTIYHAQIDNPFVFQGMQSLNDVTLYDPSGIKNGE